jgi:hypothetical protein
MALSDTLRNAYLAAQSAADDAKTEFTYTHVMVGVYDPATDTHSTVTSDVALELFMYGLDETELDWFPADWEVQKTIVHATDLAALPDTSDYVTIDGVIWRINRVKTLPGNEIFILYLVKS